MKKFEFNGQGVPPGLTDCVKQSVLSIFSTILGSQPVHCADEKEKMKGEGVIGIISFVGDSSWFMMLELPQNSAQAMASKFCGFEIEYDSVDMGDVVGELANVLAGDIVGRLSTEGVKVTMSLPSIMRGQNIKPMLPRGVSENQMRFSFAEGNFWLKLAGSKHAQGVCRTPGT